MSACRNIYNGGLGYQFATTDGRHGGQRILRPGDRHGVEDCRHQLSDGTRLWSFEGYRRDLDSWAEFDHYTGLRSETASAPDFFARFDVPAGKEWISWLLSYVRLPESVTASPLGSVAGRSGFRILRDRDGWSGYVVESVDGRRAIHTGGGDVKNPWGIARFPEDGADLLLTYGSDNDAGDGTGFAPIRGYDGESPLWEVSTAPNRPSAFPPPAFWHFLTPRDPAGSAVLRGLRTADVRDLLASGVLPSGITDPALADGVRSHIDHAARLVRTRERISRRVATIRSGALITPPMTAPDSDLLPALLGLLDHHPDAHLTVVPATLTALAADGRFLAGDIDETVRRMSPPAPPVDWTPLLGQIGAVAWRAINGRTPEAQRTALIALLRTWAAQSFAKPGAWRLGEWQPTTETTVERTLILSGHYLQPADVTSPEETPGIRTHIVTITRDDTSRIEQLLDLLSRNGSHTPSEKAVRLFAERTGVRDPIARLALDGLPRRCGFGGGPMSLHEAHDKMVSTKPYSANYVVAEQYEKFQGRLGWLGRRRLLAAGLPEDLAELWTEEGDLAAAERMAAVWIEFVGAQPYVPEELTVELEAATDLPGTFALALAHPNETTMATQNLRCQVQPAGHGWLALQCGNDSFSSYRRWNPYRDLATAVAWALTERAVGDPGCRGVIELHDRLHARLRAPKLLVVPDQPDRAAELFGPDTYPLRDHVIYDDGLIVAESHPWRSATFLRPAALSDPDALARSLRTCADHALTELADTIHREATLVTGLSSLIERAADTPVAVGRFEADPQQSAPELVAKASAALGVGLDAAALYLQLLTLPRPTDRNLRRWNGWTSARHKKTQAELVDRRLVVEDKRARAGRTAFIPGPWTEKLAKPHLPLETAKLARYLVRPQDKDIIGPYSVILPPRPLHEMFADAWASRNT
ncbi:hypothetical protein [Nocardia sp. NPDC004722]